MATEEKKKVFKEKVENRRLKSLIQADLSRGEYEAEMFAREHEDNIFVSGFEESLRLNGYFDY